MGQNTFKGAIEHVFFPQNNVFIQRNFLMYFFATCYEKWLKSAQ